MTLTVDVSLGQVKCHFLKSSKLAETVEIGGGEREASLFHD